MDAWRLVPFVFGGAMLYSSVGHGGATVYLAILTLAGLPIGPLVTTVLALNVLAASVAFVQFNHAGHVRWRLLLPFLATSVPFAYLGGRWPFPGGAQEVLLGVVLLAGAARLLLLPKPPDLGVPLTPRSLAWIAPPMGALLGFLAGATGIGGGIFLSPVLLLMGWANVREAAGIASAFIVLNSLAGLAAKLPSTSLDGAFLLPLGLAAGLGAFAGSFLGARRLPPRALQALLGAVLLVAGLRALM